MGIEKPFNRLNFLKFKWYFPKVIFYELFKVSYGEIKRKVEEKD